VVPDPGPDEAERRFRYITPVVRGPWRRSSAEALEDALQAGQAFVHRGKVKLFEFARIEAQPPAEDLGCPSSLSESAGGT
jgi:hypothetical protein